MSSNEEINITSTTDPVLFVLLLHLKQKTSVDIYYAKKDEPFSKRRITPRRIYEVRYHKSPYVDAYCHSRKAARVFRADRIRIEDVGSFNPNKEKDVINSSTPNIVNDIVGATIIREENLKATRQEEANTKITSLTDDFKLKEFSEKAMAEETTQNIDHDHVTSVIDGLRKKLFDFSKRNPLINLTHSERSVRFIRVVDELPDELYIRLKDGAMEFKSLPDIKEEPADEKTDNFRIKLTELMSTDEMYKSQVEKLGDEENDEEKLQLIERNLKDKLREKLNLPPIQRGTTIDITAHARIHHFNPSFELPKPHTDNNSQEHTDNDIQTLMLPERLDKRLRSVHEKNLSHFQETGIKVLQAAFGFLEWYESDSSDKALYAPLLLMPLEMEKQPGPKGMRFPISSNGSLAEVNLTLVEKLKTFGIKLPNFDEEDSPESYFKKVLPLFDGQPKWGLKRFVTIGIFPFQKISMYEDLDSTKWDNSELLTGNSSISRLLGGQTSSGFTSNPDNYNIDKLTADGDAPSIIMDADSSQHSAIVDVCKGKSLVIQGPPGTGKSQTIANIIATAVGQGKSVLFCAEKQAALNVVANRLKSAGLGPLLLELQKSSNKGAMIKSLKEREDLHATNNNYSLKPKLKELTKYIKEIEKHRALLNEETGFSGLNGCDLIWRYLNLKNKLEDKGLTSLRDFTPIPNLSRAQLEKDKESIRYFYEVEESDLSSPNILAGINKIDANPIAIQSLKEGSSDILQALEQCLKELEPWEVSIENFGFSSVVKFIQKITPLKEDLNESNLKFVINSFEDFSDLYKVLENKERLTSIIKKYINIEAANPEGIQNTLKNLCELEVTSFQVSKLQSIKIDLEEQLSCVAKIDGIINVIQETEGLTLKQILNISEESKQLEGLDQDSLEFLSLEMLNPVNVKKIGSLLEKIQEVQQLEKALKDGDVDIQTAIRDYKFAEINEASFEISNAGIFSFINSDVRSAKRLAAILGIQKQSNTETGKKLKSLSRYMGLSHELRENNDAKEIFKSIYEAEKTNLVSFDNLNSVIIKSNKFIKALPSLSENLKRNLPLLKALISFGLNSEYVDSCKSIKDEGFDKSLTLYDRTTHLKRQIEIITSVQPTAETCGFYSDVTIPLEEVSSGDLPNKNLLELYEQFINNEKSLNSIGEKFWVESSQLTLANAEAFIEKATIFRKAVSDLYGLSSEAKVKDVLKNILDLDFTKINFKVFSETNLLLNNFETSYSTDNTFWNDRSRADLSITNLKDIFILTDQVSEESALLSVKKINLGIRIEGTPIGNFINSFKKTNQNHSFAPDTYEFVSCKSALDLFARIHSTSLEDLSAEKIKTIKNKFVALDKEIFKLVSLKILDHALEKDIPRGNDRGPKKSYTDHGLIKNEIVKLRRHIPIRELVKRSEAALLAMKPIWLMSPLSVSQYLRRNSGTFDLLVIDEASQMRPEDALSAMVRAKQSVIVGDSQQLPPTSFFQASIDDDESEEQEVETESILDLSAQRLADSRTLRWHYRSRHPDLIRFSNKYFYENRLQIFPSPINDNSKLGITHLYSRDIYKGSVNVGEAKRVVEEAVRCMANNPDLSLGIVTMNIKQKDLIREEIESLLNKNKIVTNYYKKWKDNIEDLIIKNLENIQGDERDIIIVSTVYGANEDGNVHQRFGINSVYGHRRLNVLFTRAKRRLILVTSLKPSEIKISENTQRGVRTLRNYLEYAATERLERGDENGGETDSDFEDMVIDALRDAGYIATPQVGVDGFKIDIGVKHEDFSYGFIAGIECDGATYHSSSSARDRDRLRQDILEGLGWKIYRIWSTDWFANPKTEIKKMLSWLSKVKSSLPATQGSHFEETETITLGVEDLTSEDDEQASSINPSGVQKTFPHNGKTFIYCETYPGVHQIWEGENIIGNIKCSSQKTIENNQDYGNNISSIEGSTYTAQIKFSTTTQEFTNLDSALKWICDVFHSDNNLEKNSEKSISVDEKKMELVESDDAFVLRYQEDLISEKAELEITVDERERQQIIDNIEHLECEIEKRM